MGGGGEACVANHRLLNGGKSKMSNVGVQWEAVANGEIRVIKLIRKPTG